MKRGKFHDTGRLCVCSRMCRVICGLWKLQMKVQEKTWQQNYKSRDDSVDVKAEDWEETYGY